MSLPLPPPPAIIPVDFLRHKAPLLARDLAMQLGTGEALAAQWGLTPSQWDELREHPAFIDMVRAAAEELASPDGLAEKIRRKAALAVESGLVDVVGIMVNASASAGLRLQAFSELKELAGLTKGATPQGAAGVSGPIIQINFGDGTPTRAITVAPVIEGDAS
ncbi:MAG: hypothetical protein ACRC2H_10410 [Silanimonas sp.]